MQMAPKAKVETRFLFFGFGGGTNYIYKSSKKHHILGPQNLRLEIMDQKDEKKENVSWAELSHHVWTYLWALEPIPGEIEVSLCLSPTSSQPIRQPEQTDGHEMVAVRNGQWRMAMVSQRPPAETLQSALERQAGWAPPAS